MKSDQNGHAKKNKKTKNVFANQITKVKKKKKSQTSKNLQKMKAVKSPSATKPLLNGKILYHKYIL